MKHNSSLLACAALFLALLVFWTPAHAQTFSFAGDGNRPLEPEEAFIIEVLSIENGRAGIGWRIAEGYYLYRDQIAAHTADGVAALCRRSDEQRRRSAASTEQRLVLTSASLTRQSSDASPNGWPRDGGTPEDCVRPLCPSDSPLDCGQVG